jgi:HK97 family phage major capsid protein
MIHEMVLEKREGDLEYYRVTDWEPTEISSVSIAADPSVGMGRSQDAGGKPQTLNPVIIKGVRAMSDENVEVEAPEASEKKPAAAARSGGGQAAKTTVKPAEKPIDHAREIAAIGNEYGQPELAMRAIAEGKTVDQFKDDLLQQHQERSSSGDTKSTVVGLGDLGLSDKERSQYSVLGAIRGLLNPKLAGFEREISEELADKTGSDARGILVPYDVMGFGLRQQEVATAAKGGDLVSQELHFDKFIDALRQGTVLGSLGAKVLTGLVGNVDIPKQTGKATFAWVGEDGDSSDSDVDFGLVSLSPETVTASVPLTRRVMQQTGGSMEMLVRQDLMAGVYEALDTRLLTDILATAGIGAVPFAAAGKPTWKEVVALETEVAEANALRNSPAYLMRPALKGELKTTAKAANTAEFIWANNEVNGYRGADITSMVANKILFGDFSQAMIGLWGALDLTVDKSTKAKSGGTVLRLFQDADTAVRHAGAFALGQ